MLPGLLPICRNIVQGITVLYNLPLPRVLLHVAVQCYPQLKFVFSFD